MTGNVAPSPIKGMMPTPLDSSHELEVAGPFHLRQKQGLRSSAAEVVLPRPAVALPVVLAQRPRRITRSGATSSLPPHTVARGPSNSSRPRRQPQSKDRPPSSSSPSVLDILTDRRLRATSGTRPITVISEASLTTLVGGITKRAKKGKKSATLLSSIKEAISTGEIMVKHTKNSRCIWAGTSRRYNCKCGLLGCGKNLCTTSGMPRNRCLCGKDPRCGRSMCTNPCFNKHGEPLRAKAHEKGVCPCGINPECGRRLCPVSRIEKSKCNCGHVGCYPKLLTKVVGKAGDEKVG